MNSRQVKKGFRSDFLAVDSESCKSLEGLEFKTWLEVKWAH